MNEIQNYIGSLQNTLGRLPVTKIDEVIDILHEARLQERQIFVMGNGGSASTASHFVCDLGKNTRHANWPHFKVLGLADNMGSITAFGNDDGYDSVFVSQLEPLVRPQDVVIGVSASGNSPNVLRAIAYANEVGATTIGLTGFSGGRLHDLVDVEIHVDSDCIEQVEDVHLALEHMMVKILRERVYAEMPAFA